MPEENFNIFDILSFAQNNNLVKRKYTQSEPKLRKMIFVIHSGVNSNVEIIIKTADSFILKDFWLGIDKNLNCIIIIYRLILHLYINIKILTVIGIRTESNLPKTKLFILTAVNILQMYQSMILSDIGLLELKNRKNIKGSENRLTREQ